MAHKEKIDYLLLDIRELEKKIASMRDAEIYPVSFFSQSFEQAHKILTDLHRLEADQLEELSRQMEEHRLRLSAVPMQKATQHPEIPQPIVTEQPKKEEEDAKLVETVIVHRIIEPEEESIVITRSEPEETKAQPEDTIRKEISFGDSKSSISLNEILEKKNLSDFRKAFSLNDRFRFRRELFGGDEARMNNAVSDLNDIQSYEESVTYLHEQLQWNVEDEAVADFIKLIEKRFL